MLTTLSFLRAYLVARFGRDERGATAVEYGLIVFLIAAAVIGTVTALGLTLDGIFSDVEGDLDGA